MTYSKWEQSVPCAIKDDSLWTVEAYRLALFLADISWHDTTCLSKDCRTRSLSDQLYRSVGSISANIEEDTRKRAQRTAPAFMNTRWVPREKAAAGITRVDTC